ncbi:MAG: polysaccharide biosynthesis protein [Actinobacteria bacterium]|nr:polysaccharide biosynthesis protein [Actinomycetota bacterium]MBM3712032.1 polysaccharide biosynthesis protein [Actinomycetota bacterium]
MNKISVLKFIRFIFLDAVIVFSSFVISFFLRGVLAFSASGAVFSQYADYIGIYVAVIIVIKLVLFAVFGMYRRVWKYASIKDMVAIVEAVALSTILMGVIFYVLSQPVPWIGDSTFKLPYFPRSILIIDFLITLLLIIISRFSERALNELRFGKPGLRKKRVLIIGAGDAGETIVREMIRQKNSEYMPAGFLDDDPAKLNHRIHGIKVLAPVSQLKNVVQKLSIDEVIIAMPSVSSKLRKEIAFRVKELGIFCKTLPSLYEVIDGKAYLYQVREVNIDDILGREPIHIQTPEVISEIKDKVILITGAGGSIGSEICRQLLRFQPAELILLDHSENNLFIIENELKTKSESINIVPIVASIQVKEVIKDVFAKYKPAIIFHSAAYKHVPLMQLNPEAAIENNFIGTKILSKLSIDFGIKRFVLFSTDKAVKPRNVMGISKLLAERYIQVLTKKNKGRNTKFMIVRFGNVLESNGSVVNIFKEQIRSGGPVRVTHPKMERYLMTIQEAAQLAIQACMIGKGGEIFVLNMGLPISILELAKNMIMLFGMKPESDIDIIYTGPREGEKLSEELIREGEEELVGSEFKHIFEARQKIELNYEDLENALFCIEKEIQLNDYDNLFKDLRRVVPDFDGKVIWNRSQ